MTIELKVKSRELPSKTLNLTREDGLIPAELYGKGDKNQHIYVELKDYEIFKKKAVGVTLVDLIIDDKTAVKALIGEIQHEPVSGKVIHIDFKQIKMDEEIQAKVPLVFMGVSKAVKELGGTLIKSINELDITCLPNDLISQLEVDLTKLEGFDDVIHVSDLNLPDTIKTSMELTRTVAGVKAKIKKEVLQAMDAALPTESAVSADNKANGEKPEGESNTEAKA